mgnify:CR=1 FL=1
MAINNNDDINPAPISTSGNEYIIKTPKKIIKPRGRNQNDYLGNMKNFEVNFGVGPAGTGKTYLAVAKAVEMLVQEEVKKIILIRPAVEAGENDTLIVNKLAADTNMFGLFGYSYLVANKDKIKATKIEGKKPSLASIQDYSYPIARPLFFYVKKAHVGTVPGIKEYLKEFTAKGTMGPKGYLTDIGLVPLDSKSYKKTRTAGTKLKTIKLN